MKRHYLLILAFFGISALFGCKQTMPTQGNPASGSFQVEPSGDIIFTSARNQQVLRQLFITNLTSNSLDLKFSLRGGRYFTVRPSIQIPTGQTDSSVYVGFNSSTKGDDSSILVIQSSTDSIIRKLVGHDTSTNADPPFFSEIGSHYSSFAIKLQNILMHVNLFISSDTYHENIDTIGLLSTGNDLFPGFPMNGSWNFFKFGAGDNDTGGNSLDSKVLIDRANKIIPVLSTWYGKFINLPFVFLQDSSIYCVLQGVKAGSHIQAISYQRNEIVHDQGNKGPTTYYNGSYNFKSCVDSSQIEITIPYKK